MHEKRPWFKSCLPKATKRQISTSVSFIGRNLTVALRRQWTVMSPPGWTLSARPMTTEPKHSHHLCLISSGHCDPQPGCTLSRSQVISPRSRRSRLNMRNHSLGAHRDTRIGAREQAFSPSILRGVFLVSQYLAEESPGRNTPLQYFIISWDRNIIESGSNMHAAHRSTFLTATHVD